MNRRNLVELWRDSDDVKTTMVTERDYVDFCCLKLMNLHVIADVVDRTVSDMVSSQELRRSHAKEDGSRER